MGSAGLKYGPDGRVAWGEIWTSFCDLALAGGPPHRGKLLPPADPADVAADSDRHRAVVEEISRAARIVTGRRLVAGYAPGWVGLKCSGRAEAGWLRAAVVAENVSARRRDAVLQLPAGPGFRVEAEVKNVVVALAKVLHFWDGHLSGDQQAVFRDVDPPEAASAGEVAADPEAYQATAEYLALRAGAIANCSADSTLYPGWVGVPCDDEEMAAWLLRATVVEGVLVRREGNILCLPVGVGQSVAVTDGVVAVVAAAFRLWRAAVTPADGT